jgi:hypothetical protein
MMDAKQPFFLIIGLIVFGVALAVAMWAFSKKNVSAHRDQLISEVTHIASDAFQYRYRPRGVGGGGGSYGGYRVPNQLQTNGHAEFSVSDSAGETLSIQAISTHGIGSVSAKIGRDGEIHDFTYTGEFLE